MRRILYILYQVQAVFQMNALPLAMGAVVALAATACQKPHNSDINPTDVVSTSLCADSYLLAMPDIAPRLAALSWQSRSALSRAPAELRDLPQAEATTPPPPHPAMKHFGIWEGTDVDAILEEIYTCRHQSHREPPEL